MSAPLAIAAVAAVAALGAARGPGPVRGRRRGARNDGARHRLQIVVSPKDLIYKAMRDEDDDFIAARVYAIHGGRRALVEDVRLFYLFHEDAEFYATMGDDFDEHTADEWLSMVREGADYFNGTVFPVEVHRGLRLKSTARLDLENPGESWTMERRVAMGFATGQHVAANESGDGVMLRAEIEHPRDVDWEETLALYIPFTAISPGSNQAEMQLRVRSKGTTLLDVRRVR